MKLFFLSLLLPALILLHLLVAPHTKVEESFFIQATHDILVYGVPDIFATSWAPGSEALEAAAAHLRLAYDHVAFPGAVPRSFVGPVLLAGIAQPTVALLGFEHAQTVVRAVLGLANAASLCAFAQTLRKAFGAGVAAWWIVLMAGSFHVSFYASRTLGNIFAFGLTTFAFSNLLPRADLAKARGRKRQALSMLTFAAVVFRAEIALLLATTSAYLLASRQVCLRQLIAPVAISSVMALVLSVPIDSFFWLKPIWPELWTFYYNAILGKSSDWGVSPWHYYFTSALPRLLMNPLVLACFVPLALYQPATRNAATSLVVPSLLYVAIYSLQPHKETRFIFYVVPPITAAAALGANYIFARRTKSVIYGIASLLILVSAAGAFAANIGMLLLSSLNYPGGDALAQLSSLVHADPSISQPVVSIHIDVLSCMTGVTLFGQNPHGDPLALSPPPSRYSASASPGQNDIEKGLPHPQTATNLVFDKTEDDRQLHDPAFWARFDYLLAAAIDDPLDEAQRARRAAAQWDVVGTVHGYAGIELLRPGQLPHGESDTAPVVLGKGAQVARLRSWVRRYTGGWWVGPRMEAKIHVLKRRAAT